MELPSAPYEPTAGGFTATALTIGPRNSDLQHEGPPAALLAREVERAGGIPDGRTVRLNHDILGPVPVGPVRIATTVVRPGRRVELVEAVLDVDGRPLMRLSAWRMRTCTGGLPAAVEGPSPPVPTPLLRTCTPAPPATASGISAVLDRSTATFANVDLSVALHRPPRGELAGHGRDHGGGRLRRGAVLRRPVRHRGSDRPLHPVTVRGAAVNDTTIGPTGSRSSSTPGWTTTSTTRRPRSWVTR
jgi:hypothetical protein